MIKLANDHARRFLIARHALAPPRALSDIERVFARIGSVQVDPLVVTGLRNHDLVLAARVAAYRPALLDRALYVDRSVVELYDKSLCIVPVAELPFHVAEWRLAAREIKARGGVYQQSYRGYGAALLRKLDREGPLSTRDLSQAGKKVRAGWAVATEGRAALHVLVRTGKVLTVRREGNMRFWDRSERVVPKKFLESRVDPEDATRHRVLGRFRAMGLLGLRPSAEVFISTTTASERVRIVEDLVAEKKLVPVEVDGVGTRYVVSADLPLIEASARPARGAARAALLAPLDPMMWDRKLLGPLFGFEYRWGVYTPRHKRPGGYYDLPIVLGDRVIGMIEPVYVREKNVLKIVRCEVPKRLSSREKRAIDTAVDAHRRAIGADSVEWR